jgi:hypothetical protein
MSFAMRCFSARLRLALGRLVDAEQLQDPFDEDRLGHRPPSATCCIREVLGKPQAFSRWPVYQLSRTCERAPLQVLQSRLALALTLG